jgi:hypothetical protein
MAKLNKLQRARDVGILEDGWRYEDYYLAAGPAFGWLCSIL